MIIVMRVIKKGGKDIVFCNTCKKYLIADKADKEVEEWYKEHNKEHTKGIVEGNTPYIPNYKGDKRRIYCLICKESCYPSLNGKIPESKEEFDLWYNNHSSLFHKNEELIPVDISKIEEKKKNAIREEAYASEIIFKNTDFSFIDKIVDPNREKIDKQRISSKFNIHGITTYVS